MNTMIVEGDGDVVLPKKLAMRFLIEHPIHGWHPISENRAMALYRGERGMVDLAGKTVRVATAYMLMEGRVAQSLLKLEMSHWQFDDAGRVDQQVAMSKIIEKLDRIASDKHQQVTFAESELRAICIVLGVPMRQVDEAG